MLTFSQFVKEGAEEHTKFADHTKNPFHKTLAAHGFEHKSTTHEKNRFAPDNPKYDSTVHHYTHPQHGKSSVSVTQEHDPTVGHGGQKSSGNSFIHRHEQSNGIIAPSTGDNKNQLHRSLSQEYGVPKGMDAPKPMSWEKHNPFKYKMNESEEPKDVFHRLATKQEANSAVHKSRAFRSMPDKEGHDKVFKPYGEQGRGFYYAPKKK